MPITNFPQGVSSFGVPVMGSGILASGQVFWVNSVTGADANGRGTDISRPFKTINYALSKCKNSNGDIIFVMPNHLETISAAGSAASPGPTGSISVNVVGVSIIGLGNKSDRPFIKWSATAGQFLVNAANLLVVNCVFDMYSLITAVAAGITVAASGCQLVNCLILQSPAGATNVATIAVSLTSGWADFFMYNTDIWGEANASTASIQISAAGNKIRLERCRINGNSATATISGTSGTITEIFINECTIGNQASNAPVLNIPNASSGIMRDTYLDGNGWVAVTGPFVNSTGMKYCQVFGIATANKNGVYAPAQASTI